MNIIQQRVGDVHVVQIEGNEFEINALRQAAANADTNGVRGAVLTEHASGNTPLMITVKVVPPVPPEK